MALAGWAGIEGESEDDNGSERTQKVNGRLTHEKTSKNGGTNEFAVVLVDRFVVSAKGTGVDVGTLKAAASGMSLAKLESIKDPRGSPYRPPVGDTAHVRSTHPSRPLHPPR